MGNEFTTFGYLHAKHIVENNKNLQDRVFKLVKNGFTIATRYTLKSSGY